MDNTRSEFGRAWKVLTASMVGVACGASPLPFITFGFFIDPLQQEFGWSRTEISIGVTIYGILAALLAPVFGGMADRYGVRPVALGSLAIFGLTFAAFAIVPGRREHKPHRVARGTHRLGALADRRVGRRDALIPRPPRRTAHPARAHG